MRVSPDEEVRECQVRLRGRQLVQQPLNRRPVRDRKGALLREAREVSHGRPASGSSLGRGLTILSDMVYDNR